ncbi:MAG: GGDEF domain-containing protein [Solirubrobacteraceae bacterium]
MTTISATTQLRRIRTVSVPTPAWTLAALNGAAALSLGVGAIAPLSPDAPARLAYVLAGLLAVSVVITLGCSTWIGERTLLAQAGGRVMVSVAMAAYTMSGGGTILVCAGFITMAFWVALFFPRRVLALMLVFELGGVLVAFVLSHDPQRTLLDAGAMWVASSFGSLLFAHLVDGLRRQARTDHLTGLLNRHGIEQSLSEHRWRRRASSPMSLVVIDLNRLKEVNDQGGHLAGDRLLEDFAAELCASVGPRGYPGRTGGDEFIAILPGLSAGHATDWVERWQADTGISWSFGVAQRFVDEPLASWYARADRQMYDAKTQTPDRRPALLY